MSWRNRIGWTTALLLLAVHRAAYAQQRPSETVTRPSGSNTISNPLKQIETIEGLIEVIINLALKIGIPIAALMIIYSGFLFVTAQGDVKQIDAAKFNFKWTIIGTAILLAAATIVNILQGTINSLGV